MKEIIIIPHIGIGQLKLGMAPDELENALLQMKKQWSNSSDEAMQMERCAETGDPNLITGRYMDNDSFFLVQYRNGKATEIGIQRKEPHPIPLKFCQHPLKALMTLTK